MKKNQKRFLEKISSYIREIDEIPLFGNSLPLNLEDLSASLATQFGVEDFTVRLKKQEWKEKEDLKTGMKGKLFISPIYLSPLEEPVYWVMTKADKDKLTAQMFSNNKKKAPVSQVIQDGFYRFLLLEALSGTQALEPIQQMSLCLEEDCDLPDENALCIDLEIAFQGSTSWGRCLITDVFRKKWVQHFSAFPPQYTPTQLAQHLPLEIGIKIGSVQLLTKEWKKLKKGDFILPDAIATENKGILILGGTPLFQVYIHQNQIELLDYAFNVEDSMEESELTPIDTLSHKLETVEKESKAIKDLPLHVSVELARLKIPLDQLMALSPGNLLELPSLADKKISLIVNGQKIGVAELVYLGETLGLKVLEI